MNTENYGPYGSPSEWNTKKSIDRGSSPMIEVTSHSLSEEPVFEKRSAWKKFWDRVLGQDEKIVGYKSSGIIMYDPASCPKGYFEEDMIVVSNNGVMFMVVNVNESHNMIKVRSIGYLTRNQSESVMALKTFTYSGSAFPVSGTKSLIY